MALGGIPYYLGYLKRNLSLAQNLDALFFERGAKLEDEFHRLFVSIFDNPPFMQRIIRAITANHQGLTRGEILQRLNIKDGEVFAKALRALIACDFVLKYVPFGHKANEPHYKLIDPFCIFFLRFRDEGVMWREHFWQENLDAQQIVSWRGIAFENVCWNHIPQIKRALGIQGVSAEYSAWTKKPDDEAGLQIDLLISRKDHVVNMCEIKFYGDDFTVDQDYYRVILRRREILAGRFPKVTAIHSTLITTYGLKHNEYEKAFTDVITIDDLFM